VTVDMLSMIPKGIQEYLSAKNNRTEMYIII
jgi:hypothetical protein